MDTHGITITESAQDYLAEQKRRTRAAIVGADEFEGIEVASIVGSCEDEEAVGFPGNPADDVLEVERVIAVFEVDAKGLDFELDPVEIELLLDVAARLRCPRGARGPGSDRGQRLEVSFVPATGTDG